MKLVIAEKPSVAMSIAKVLGVKDKKDGYIEGNGYIVSWCLGHLIQMANPEQYDDQYSKWNIEDLPIIPNEYLYDVSKSTKKQYQVLKKLLTSKTISEVINACDAGREGELIFRLVYNQSKSILPIKRLWISSLEDQAIQEGFKNLKRGENYNHLYQSALARAKADWLIGMNMSRLYSCLYRQHYSVGRVQTPVLAMIVDRDESIKNFKKEKYYVGELNLGSFTLSTGRMYNYEIVEDLVYQAIGTNIKITDVIKKEKTTRPDLLYDLTTLQREANRYFGLSAKDTLDIAQKLYEQKLITYPRTDSRYLSNDMIISTVNSILGKYDFDTSRIKEVFNSEKVTDHHAIIPTSSSMEYDLSKLNTKEKNIYDLILNKTYASFGYPLKEITTKIIYVYEVQGDTYEFTTNGKVVVDEGFTKYLKQYKKESKEEILSDVNVGDTFEVINKEIKEKFTSPPKHYTEESILKAMEIAGTEFIDKEVEVERKGLGTPATRAGIIETLILKGFIIREKKNHLVTEKGIQLITIVADFLKNANTTAIWEMKLYDISIGKFSEQEFLKEIEDTIKSTIQLYEIVKKKSE
ncbi:DNA topoisomerase 3 [Gemella sp. zg-1178]|uniref:DNA topoisomerase 3 n=1 Tax=Gemella sp. zg-1178 TaxID=2840372 RepID=UPI001C03E54B|nr:DNA topoisomerase 3 [Gemella sp. zg-1178]MBU0279178.1 DNA topoisomerase 3 [Gemella sp. zg-1178]